MAEEKLKGLFVGDLVAETGFSTVMHNIIKYNKDEFDITGLGVNYRGDPHDYDFPIYPAGTGRNIYGIDRLCNLIMSFDYDFVFILNDSWVLSYYLEAIKKNVTKKLPKIVVYFPVDSRYHDRSWYRDFDIVSRAFTYTQFGKDVVNDPYCVPEMELGVIPHGVDSNDFYKIYETNAPAKMRLFGEKFGESSKDLFVVLNANRNQPRKRLDVTIAGFNLFAEGKPENVKLYMHCGVQDEHVDIIRQMKRYGDPSAKRLIFTSMTRGIQRISKERLNLLYNASDIGVNTSLGEGWGLTNVEHAVTGAVQVVPRHSSCQELFGDCGILTETVADWTFDRSETVGRLTSPEEVARCLQILYVNESLREGLGARGRKKFIQPEYEWKTIAGTWRDVFKEVCEEDVTSISK